MGAWWEDNKKYIYSKRAGVFGGASLCLLCLFAIVVMALYPPLVSASLPEERVNETVIFEPLDMRPVLVLDAGHGGEDPGALDAGLTISEAEINQQVANRVEKLLQYHMDELNVLQSHPAGEAATTEQRAKLASQENADLLLSLHLNSDWGSNVRGFQCFSVPPGRVHYQESMRFSEIIIENMKNTDAEIMGTCGIYYAFYYQTDSGDYLKDIYDSGWFDHEQPRQDETFGVLEYAGCPAVLVEQWYISNPADMQLFYTEDGMDTMAWNLYLSVCEYFTLQPQERTDK